jgi:hypothetical protein
MKRPNFTSQIQKLDALNDALAKKVQEARIIMHQVVQEDIQLLQMMIEPNNSKISRRNNGHRK